MATKKLTAAEIKERNQKSMGRDHPRLKKARVQIEELKGQLSQSSMGLLNMRQMYEGAIQEKQQLQAQARNLETMLIAAVSQSRGKTLTLKKKSLENIQKFAGLDTKVEDGDLILSALTVEEVQALQEDLDEEGV